MNSQIPLSSKEFGIYILLITLFKFYEKSIMPLMSTWNYHSIVHRLCVHAKSLQWCPSLCDLMGHSLPASSVHGILQATKRSGLLCPPPGGLPHPGIDPTSLYLLILFLFFIFILLYNTVLVFPYIDMNPPWVYTSSQS